MHAYKSLSQSQKPLFAHKRFQTQATHLFSAAHPHTRPLQRSIRANRAQGLDPASTLRPSFSTEDLGSYQVVACEQYVSEHGGKIEGCTTFGDTNYHFEVNNDCFEEALDRFAQLFIAPVLSEDATMREIEDIDSEDQKNRLDDMRRMTELETYLTQEGHPFQKFSSGNLKTLKVRAQEKVVDIRLELIKFFKEKYSANIMHLVIYAKDSLDRIQSMVEQRFQEIHYKKGPYRYLAHLLCHRGEGSLFYNLRTLDWATYLYSGECFTNEDSFFRVNINLTDAGHDHVQDIVGLLFKYMDISQKSGVSKWIFEELSRTCEANFHYKNKTSPSHYVTNISSAMRAVNIKN